MKIDFFIRMGVYCYGISARLETAFEIIDLLRYIFIHFVHNAIIQKRIQSFWIAIINI